MCFQVRKLGNKDFCARKLRAVVQSIPQGSCCYRKQRCNKQLVALERTALHLIWSANGVRGCRLILAHLQGHWQGDVSTSTGRNVVAISDSISTYKLTYSVRGVVWTAIDLSVEVLYMAALIHFSIQLKCHGRCFVSCEG